MHARRREERGKMGASAEVAHRHRRRPATGWRLEHGACDPTRFCRAHGGDVPREAAGRPRRTAGATAVGQAAQGGPISPQGPAQRAATSGVDTTSADVYTTRPPPRRPTGQASVTPPRGATPRAVRVAADTHPVGMTVVAGRFRYVRGVASREDRPGTDGRLQGVMLLWALIESANNGGSSGTTCASRPGRSPCAWSPGKSRHDMGSARSRSAPPCRSSMTSPDDCRVGGGHRVGSCRRARAVLPAPYGRAGSGPDHQPLLHC